MTTAKGKIVTPAGVVDGCVAFEHGRIVEIGPSVRSGSNGFDFGAALIVPGFIDLHMHGLGQFRVFQVSEIVEVAQLELSYGTTGFLPTIGSLPPEQYVEFGHNVCKAQKESGPRAAKILGAHYEGPFINPQGKGGMDEAYLRPVDLQECKEYIDQANGALKLMTLSPELKGGEALIKLLRKYNIVASLGHSRASEEDLRVAVKAGLRQVCHLFNAFERSSLRDGWQWAPGLLEHILVTNELNCELICDMFHVLPEYVKLTANMLGPNRFIAITDSMQGAGLRPGKYKMVDGREFTTEGPVARLTSTGTVVGSILTMNRAFANLVERCNLDLVTASRFTSTNAARALGISDRLGSIEVGKCANLAVLDSDYHCMACFVEGRLVYGD